MNTRTCAIVAILSAALLLAFVLTWAEPVTMEMVQQAVSSQLEVVSQRPPEGEGIVRTVAPPSELRDKETDELLSFVFELSPIGYIVVSPDTRIRPIIAYSYSSDFSWEEVLQNILLHMLRVDLAYRLEAVEKGAVSEDVIRSNERLWDIYLGKVSGVKPPIAAYTWGPWITFPTWNQGAPYWNNCPLDSVTGLRCVVGCVATALAQILNYWQYPSSVTFLASDNYSYSYDPGDGNGTRNMSITATTANLASINYNNSYPNDTTKAQLSYAAGVSVHMMYTSAASGTWTQFVANALVGGVPQVYTWPNSWNRQVWGYTTADFRTMTDNNYSSPYYVNSTAFYSQLLASMQAGRPATLGISGPLGGHEIVCDGYRTTGEYHLNFGWGGSTDGWYFLPITLPPGLNVVDDAAMNIQPPSSRAVFRVTDTGDVHADGAYHSPNTTIQAGSADVAEWVPVSESVEPGDVLELDPSRPGHYRKARSKCSTLVAGVVSTNPGVILGSSSPTLDIGPWTLDSALLALLGIVPVNVTDENGPIQPGDLLVVSSTAGHAMRWDPDPADGEACGLVGKALEPLDSGAGMIQMLLMR